MTRTHPDGVPDLRRNIASEELHHGKHTFVEELTELPGDAGVEYQEKYLHDLHLFEVLTIIDRRFPEVFAPLRLPATVAQPSGLHTHPLPRGGTDLITLDRTPTRYRRWY